MSRIEGPSRGRPPEKPDHAGSGKPAEDGEFDRVLEERETEAPAGGSTPAGARRGAAGGAAAKGKGQTDAGSGGGAGGAGGAAGAAGEGASGGAGGTGALPRGRLGRGAAPGLVSGAPGQPATGAPAGPPATPGAAAQPQAGAVQPQPVVLPPSQFGPLAGTGPGAGVARGVTPEPGALPVEGAAAAAGRESAAAPASDAMPEPTVEPDPLETEAPPPGAVISPQASPVLGPATAPSEAPPPAPASDPALVRQVAQQVLAGIESHLVAGRTQVELGLDLGALGQARVDLARGTSGALQVTFRLDTAEAQLAVARNLPDLAQALEQKGYAPTIELRAGDGSALGGEAGRDQSGRQGASGREQGQGRSRGQYVPPVEEER